MSKKNDIKLSTNEIYQTFQINNDCVALKFRVDDKKEDSKIKSFIIRTNEYLRSVKEYWHTPMITYLYSLVSAKHNEIILN